MIKKISQESQSATRVRSVIGIMPISRSCKVEIYHGRLALCKKLDKIIEPKGFDREYINSKSFFELEEENHLGHYNLYGYSNIRKGYNPISPFSKQRIEDDVRYLLTD